MNWPTILHTQQRSIRFCLFFVACMAALALVFELSKSFFAWAYMYPVSTTATGLLGLMAFDATLDTTQLPLGFCEMILGRISYRVTFDCTGLFFLLVFLALTTAYPTSLKEKGFALALGVAGHLRLLHHEAGGSGSGGVHRAGVDRALSRGCHGAGDPRIHAVRVDVLDQQSGGIGSAMRFKAKVVEMRSPTTAFTVCLLGLLCTADEGLGIRRSM